MSNIDVRTVEDFGREWSTFDQSCLSNDELHRLASQYFRLLPLDELPAAAVGFDFGCGSGRWARVVAPKVGCLHCVDASSAALAVARRALANQANCVFHLAGGDGLLIPPESMDFGYSLGVLHHLPDPEAGLRACVNLLKPGAPFLVYLYYALDNRPGWYRALWRVTDLARRRLSVMPHRVKLLVSRVIATVIYFPLATIARGWERLGWDPALVPLAQYRRLSFYSMRTDALDRFGTRLERRFTFEEVKGLLQRSGLTEVTISEEPPYWCAVGYRTS